MFANTKKSYAAEAGDAEGKQRFSRQTLRLSSQNSFFVIRLLKRP